MPGSEEPTGGAIPFDFATARHPIPTPQPGPGRYSMPSLQPVLSAHPHRNQRLFSDHNLDTVLPALSEWKHGAAGAAPILAGIRDLYARFTPSTNEAQTEEELIKPIIRLLGHDFEVQPSIKSPDGVKRPDYILYAHLPAPPPKRTLSKGLLRRESSS